MDLDVAGSSGPTKSVQFNLKVHRAAQIAFVDFGGRSDANSIHTILGHLRPSKVKSQSVLRVEGEEPKCFEGLLFGIQGFVISGAPVALNGEEHTCVAPHRLFDCRLCHHFHHRDDTRPPPLRCNLDPEP
jgi:hypothetical protein